MNPNDRFVEVYRQIERLTSGGATCRILVDRVTGVNYLCAAWGHGTGLTPLLDADGKPVVTPMERR